MNPNIEEKGRFKWDYPSKGFVYDKDRCCFAEYPKHIKSLEGFLVELMFYPRHLDTTESGSLYWRPDKEIVNPYGLLIDLKEREK